MEIDGCDVRRGRHTYMYEYSVYISRLSGAVGGRGGLYEQEYLS